jgi:hypothetical protein
MRKVFLFISVAMAFASCKVKENVSQSNHTIQPMTTSKLFDPHSAATSDARVTHLHWTANVNVETHVISANATFDFIAEKGAKQISFDTKDLNIEWVKVNGRKAFFSMDEVKPFLGQALHVEIKDTDTQVSIEYTTSPNAEALKLKRFIAWHEISVRTMAPSSLPKRLMDDFKAAEPLVKWLRAAGPTL